MRGIPLVLLAAALPAFAQVGGFGPPPGSPQPPWMEVFRKMHQPQGQASPLGAFDQEVENAWAAALAAGPAEQSFEHAAQQAAEYFGRQGYDRKAEIILRQAISAAAKADAAKARTLRLALAQRLNQEQKFFAAAAVVQEVLEEVKAAPDQAALNTRIRATTQLAQIREQMGELDAAEALLRDVEKLQSSPAPQPPSFGTVQYARAAGPGFAAFRMGSFARPYAAPSDLANFYQRQGDVVKAEALYKKEIEAAKTPQGTSRSIQNYANFLNSQQRWEEGGAQLEKLIAMESASSQPETQQALVYHRQALAQSMAMAGKPEKAMEILRENVARTSGDAAQQVNALQGYANMLIQQKQFDEAEKVIEQMRQPTGKNAAEVAKHAQTMADHFLANLRQMQNRTEEARALRERTIAQPQRPEGTPVPVWNLLQPIQEAMARHKYDEAMAQAERVLAEAAPRLRSNPEEISAFTNLLHQWPQGRQEERQQLMRMLFSALDSVTPADHPRVALAIGQLVSSTMHAGLGTAEAARLLEREEKILVAAKGEDSPALNDVSRQRAQLFSFRGDHAEAAAEMKRAVKRSEAASGPKSGATLQMMRELTNSLQMSNDNWPEEETVRLAIIEHARPNVGGSLGHDMSMLASRYFAVGQRENAVAWMDKAIELARANPQMATIIPGFEQQRNHFANAQNQPQPMNPFFGAAPGYSTTRGGVLLGNRPVPTGVRSVIGQPVITPHPPPPPPPPK